MSFIFRLEQLLMEEINIFMDFSSEVHRKLVVHREANNLIVVQITCKRRPECWGSSPKQAAQTETRPTVSACHLAALASLLTECELVVVTMS